MRVQHPKVHERKDRGSYYWFIRYWHDEVLPDGSLKPHRKFHTIGPSRGPQAITKKQANVERDKFLATINVPTERQAVAKGMALFRELAQMYIESHLERQNKVSEPTRQTERSHLRLHIIPRWGDKRLNEIEPKEVEDWLYATFDSWWTMKGVRKVMSAVYHKAEQWGYWEEGKRNPLAKVDIGRKTYKRPRRILTMEQTAKVLSRLEDPYLLISETCIATSTRISEALGLKRKHLDLKRGVISIEQRVWHQNVDEPKSDRSARTLALGNLVERYRDWIRKKGITDPEAWIFAQEEDPKKPMWDSGVRRVLHAAAKAEGCDFAGLGPHSFRRANITWRQEVGATSIEAQQIAGHSSLDITNEYTFVAIERQAELTRAIQQKLAAAASKKTEEPPGPAPTPAAPEVPPSLADAVPATRVIQ